MYLGLISVLVSVYWLFTIKQHVEDLTQQLLEVNQQIQQEQDYIHVFNAELSYLKSPKRLKQLATKYLDLQPIQPEQLIANIVDDSKNMKINLKKYNIAKIKKAPNKSNKHLVNWRYKKPPTKVFHGLCGSQKSY